MASDNQIKITNLPKASEVKSGDYIILETGTGTAILDYKDFIIGSDNVTFWTRLSGNTTNIKALSTTQTSLSSELASFRTTVSNVSGLSGIVWKNTWNNSTTYKVSQAVEYNNSSYIALTENTNQQPVDSSGNLNSNWNYLAKAGVGDLTNTGGILVGIGDGTSIQLDPGNSGYVLKSQGTGNQVVWAQEDTGSGRSYCSKLSLGAYTSNCCDFTFHYVMADGQVRSAGEGDELGAGFNSAWDWQSATPIPVTMPYDYDWQSADHKVKDVYRGFNHTYILTDGGHVYGCGSNTVGQLGIGNTTDQYTFAKITFPDSDVKIREIVLAFDDGCSGWTHYFIAEGHGSGSNDGRVYACGDNNSGQIGDGTLTDRTSPVRTGTLIGVEKLWAWGGAETAAFCRLSGGGFYAWGDVVHNGYRGVHAADGSTAANVQSPVKQGTDGFKPGDATAPYGLHGVDDMRVQRSYNGSAYYSSTFALLTSGHVYGVGYNDSSRQMGQGHATNNVTTFTIIPSVSAAYAFDTHAASSSTSVIATCSAIEGGSWNSTTMKYEGFTDQTSVSGVKLIYWGHNGTGQSGDGTTTTFPVPRIMNNYLPTALCASVSSVICERHSRSNGGAMTYIRDLSGYYWFAGYNGYGLDTGNDLNQAAVPQVNTFKKISLPVHPSEIKDFQVAVTDFVTACSRTAAVILTHNGRVFVNGDLKYTFGIGFNESGASDHARTNWYPVRF